MDRLVAWSNSLEANKEEFSSFMDSAGDWRLFHVTERFASLLLSENMYGCVYYCFLWKVPLLSCIRGIPFPDGALVSLSQCCSSPNCLLLPPTLAHSPELPC